MNTNDYWKKSGAIAKQLNSFFLTFCKKNPEFLSVKADYLNKKHHLNGIQFYAGFMAGGGKKWEKYIVVPVIIELIMLWAYKTNQIIDEKKSVWESRENIKTTVLQHDLLLALILKLLESSKSILKDNFLFFDSLIKEMLSAMVKGFYIEKEKLNINFTPLKHILKSWEQNYSTRNKNLNAVYENAPLIGYWLASSDKQIFIRYNNFFKNRMGFSEVGQIMNDVGDWVNIYDKNTKVYQDRFADIRNGIITLPIQRLISNTLIVRALTQPKITLQSAWQKNILLQTSEVVSEVKKMGKECFSDLVVFWSKNSKSKENFILQTYLLLKDNKFIKV